MHERWVGPWRARDLPDLPTMVWYCSNARKSLRAFPPEGIVTPRSPYDLYCELAEEGAAAGLLALMTGLSEEYWCASWLIDLEYRLWQVVAGTKFEGRQT